MSELVFEVTQEAHGGYFAECLTEAIFTQADSWEEVRTNVIDAITAFYFDRTPPSTIYLHRPSPSPASCKTPNRHTQTPNASRTQYCPHLDAFEVLYTRHT